jgi:hypothetical protein
MHHDHLLIPVTGLRTEGRNPAAKTRLLSFDRMQSRVVIGLLTGHNTLRRYLDKIRLTNSPVCRKCGAVEETSPHVLCEAFVTLTHTVFFLLDPEDFKWLSMGDISLKYNQQDAMFSRSIYFYKLLYMFQAVPSQPQQQQAAVLV